MFPEEVDSTKEKTIQEYNSKNNKNPLTLEVINLFNDLEITN